MIKCQLICTILVLLMTLCQSAPVKSNYDQVKENLRQSIKDANINKHSTVAEIHTRISPLFITNHAAQKGYEYLQEVGVSSDTIKAYKYHRHLVYHNQSRSIRKAAGNSGIKEKKAQPGVQAADKKSSSARMQKRLKLHKEARDVELSTLGKRIRQAGLDKETDPYAFLPHENALGEVWSKKKFTGILAEYMRTTKGISDFKRAYGRARTMDSRRQKKGKAPGEDKGGELSSVNPLTSASSSLPRRWPDEVIPLLDSPAKLDEGPFKPMQSQIPTRRRSKKVVHTSDEKEEWEPEPDEGKLKGLASTSKVNEWRDGQRASKGGASIKSPAVLDDTPSSVTAINNQAHKPKLDREEAVSLYPVIPEWPSSGKRRRQQKTQSQYHILKRPTVAGKSYRGSQSVVQAANEEARNDSQPRPTMAGKSYTGGAARDRPTVGKKTFTGAGPRPFPKAGALALRRPEQKQQQAQPPSPSKL